MHLDRKTEKDTFEPSTISFPTATTTVTAPASLPDKKKATKPLGNALDPSKTRKRTSWPNSCTRTSKDNRILLGCHLSFLTSSKNPYTTTSSSQSPISGTIRSWIETDNNPKTHDHRRDLHLLAKSLVGKLHHHLQIRPQVCRVILAKFQEEYLHYSDSPDDWKRVEEKFGTRWNVPHSVRVIDGKHIAMKKPKKSGSNYYNYKGFFSMVLLALVEAVVV